MKHALSTLASVGGRRLRGAAVLAVCAAAVLAGPGGARAAICQQSGPVAGSYTVTVCFSAPGDQSLVSGDATVTATATVTAGGPGVQRMVFSLDGHYLLTDYQAPYTFTLPTSRFVDGAKTLSVAASMRDTFVSQEASVGLEFLNGVSVPPTNTNAFTPTPGTQPAAGQPFVVGAVGDGAGGETTETDVTNEIAGWNPNLLLYLGDVYEDGTITEFYNWYAPEAQAGTFYGRFRSITDPTVGNHEYHELEDGTAPGYFDYWDNIPHYYSVDTHGWHIVALDSTGQFRQTSTSSPQYQWLAQDLSANTQPCTLVMYHQPLFNIGDEGQMTSMTNIWSLLAQHGVDLVLNGHDHTYQRYQPLDGSGNLDPSGVTEIVVGTGGHAIGDFITTDSRLAASALTYGAVRLELNAAGASYQFVSTQGQAIDSGSVQCSPGGPDAAPPSIPSNLSATASYKTRIDLSWTGSTDNVGVTGYDVYRDGQLLTTTGAGTTYSDNTVLPGQTHEYMVRARDAAGNVSGFSNSATATTPTFAVLFHDGFETGTLANWTNPAPTSSPSNNGLTAQQSQVFAGSWAAESISSGLGASAWKTVSPTQTNLYYVARFKVLSQGANNINLMRFRNNLVGANAIATLFVTSTDKIGLRNDVAGTSVTSTTAAARGVWHTAELHAVVNGTSSSTEVWIDGVAVAALSQTGINLGTNPMGRLELGDPSGSRTFDVAFDEVAYDSDFIGDITAPTAPSSLVATAHSGLEVDLAWTAGADDVAVTGYDVYRNGALVASIGAGTSYADKAVAPLNSYAYQLVAKDAAGNVSGFSNTASVSTGDVFTDDFESGTLSKWTSVSGLTTQQSVVDGGEWAARATSDGTAGSSAQVTLDSTVGDLYYRVRFKRISQGSNNSVVLVRFRTAANSALAAALIGPTGTLSYRNDTEIGGNVWTTQSKVSFNVWHELQMHLFVNGGSSRIELWLDGVLAARNDESFGTAPIGRLELGEPATGRVFDIAFDNVVADPMFIADAATPTSPANLRTTAITGTAVDLAWDGAEDDVGVTAYRVYRDGAAVADVDGSTLSYLDSTVDDAATYTYVVTALDAVGHESAASNAAQASTPDVTSPTAPTDLSGAFAPGPNEADLSWSAATDNVGVTAYLIYRDGTQIDSVGSAATSYADPAVEPSTAYTYTVVAVDAAGNASAESNAAHVTTADTIAPSAPTGLTATAVSGTGVDLAWNAATDDIAVTGYRIYRDGSQIASVDGATRTYGDGGLTSAVTYHYVVRAVDAAGNVSDPSNEASATTPDVVPPTAPTGLTAAAGSGPRVDLAWSGSSDNVGVTSYAVYRNGAQIATVGGATTTYSDATVSQLQTYTYTVRASDAAGNASQPSNAASATTPDATAPTAPTGLSAATPRSKVNLSWLASTDNVGVTGYTVYRNGVPLATVGGATTSYSDTTVVSGVAYTYYVVAFDAAGNGSQQSNTVTVALSDGTPPSVPGALQATAAGGHEIDLAWTASTDNVAVTGYSVFRAGVKLTDVGGSTTTYKDLAVADATAYSYTVKAFDGAGNLSAASNTATATTPDVTTPSAPSGLKTTTVTNQRVDLAWTASTDNAGVTGYRVFRNGSTLANVAGTTRAYSDTTVAVGTTYTYTVTALDAAGNMSAPSGSVTARPPLFGDGFESGNLSNWTTVGGLVAQSKQFLSGTWGAEGASGPKGAAAFAVKQFAASQSQLYYEARVKIISSKTAVDVMRLRTGTGASLVTLSFDAQRKLGYSNDVRTTSTTSANVLNVGQWYDVRLHVLVNGASSLVEVWLDGTKITALSKTEDLGTTAIGRAELGESVTGRNYDLAFDDVTADPTQ